MFNRKNIFLKQTIDSSDTRQQGTVRQSPGQEVIDISFVKRLITTTCTYFRTAALRIDESEK